MEQVLPLGLALHGGEGQGGGVVDDDGHSPEVVVDPLVHPPHLLLAGQVRRQRVQLPLLAGQPGSQVL